MKLTIKDCKLREVISCDNTEDIVTVAKKLKNEKQRHIIVTEKDKPIGIISTTDINNRVVAENKDLKKTKAQSIMTSKILVKDINEDLVQTYLEMIKDNIFSCPVTTDEKLIGTLDLKEVMNHIVKLKPEK
ncbi:CBS domain-containing protein [Candidatus Pacearchaeota archaeon]|nr:CBS domain-containing protein [Candidatus Pacearchaeota archaeon]